MNWNETRARLLAHGIDPERLPEEWEPGIDLRWSDLTGAKLDRAHLTGVDLRWSYLRWADLAGADLAGADLYGADLRWSYLYGAVYDDHTRWPAGFDPEAAGAEEN